MRGRYPITLAILVVATVLLGGVAAGVGAYYIPPWEIPGILWAHDDSTGYRILAYLRFPRVALGLIVGAALATAGAGLQGLFRNPLADPQLIGITSGAGLGAALWIVLSGGAFLTWGLPMAAFVAGTLTVGVVWAVTRVSGTPNTATLLLAGIACNSICMAGVGVLAHISDEEELRGLTFWQLGGLGFASWPLAAVTAIFCLIGLGLLLSTSRALNALALGESEAYHLGISLRSVQRRIVVGAAMSVGAAAAAAGGIGFIGLVVPHLLRLSMGADHRWLLPASALGGALLLVLADLGARTLVAPTELPVGILTAFVGGPFFIGLILWSARRRAHA